MGWELTFVPQPEIFNMKFPNQLKIPFEFSLVSMIIRKDKDNELESIINNLYHLSLYGKRRNKKYCFTKCN